MKLLKLEFFKCRRRKILLVCAAVLAAELVWIVSTFARQDAEDLLQGWMLLLYDLAMVDAIIMPISVATIASRNCELEHKGTTLKLLETMASPGALYAQSWPGVPWCWRRCFWSAGRSLPGWASCGGFRGRSPGSGWGCSP